MMRVLTIFFLSICFVLPRPSAAVDFDPGSHMESLELLKKSLYKDPSSREKKEKLIEYYLVMGREKIKKGKYEEALVLLEEGEGIAPEEQAFCFLKGLSYFLMKRLYEAESELMKIAYDEAATADPLKLLGRVYYDRADLDAALDVWEEALLKTPEDEELKTMMAKVRKESAVESSMAEAYTGRFLLQYDGDRDEAMGQKVADILASAYEDVGIDIGHYPESDIVVILYTNRQFKEITDSPDWVGGIYDGKVRVPVGGGNISQEGLEALLYHEYTHAAIHSLAGSRVPGWLNEGLATYEQSRFHQYHQGVMQKAVEGGTLLKLPDMDAAFSSDDSDKVRLAYEQSYAFVIYLIDNYGIFKISQVLSSLPRVRAVDELFSQVYGDNGKDLNGLFRDWLKTVNPDS